tara:strand:- start:3 stop:509 length:507 start_codon:yes stop_codon:yes gene_type:complete
MKQAMLMISKLTAVLAVLCFLVMTFAILLNVFYRYVLNDPITWCPELSRFMMVAVTLFASSLAIRQNSHVGVTILVTRFPIKIQIFIYFINAVLISAFLLVLLYYGAVLAFVEGPLQTAPSLRISMMFAFIPLPLGAFLMLLQVFEKTYSEIKQAANGKSPFDQVTTQ